MRSRRARGRNNVQVLGGSEAPGEDDRVVVGGAEPGQVGDLAAGDPRGLSQDVPGKAQGGVLRLERQGAPSWGGGGHSQGEDAPQQRRFSCSQHAPLGSRLLAPSPDGASAPGHDARAAGQTGNPPGTAAVGTWLSGPDGPEGTDPRGRAPCSAQARDSGDTWPGPRTPQEWRGFWELRKDYRGPNESKLCDQRNTHTFSHNGGAGTERFPTGRAEDGC